MSNFDKIRYDNFVDESPQGSIFAKSWWLDMWSDKWECIFVENAGKELLCAMPIVSFSNRIGEINISQPPLTRYLGIMFRGSSGRSLKIYSEQNQLTNELLTLLPKYDHFSMCFHYAYDFWLPFRDHGFSQETYYTYVLDTSQTMTEITSGYRENIRREIRKAERRNVVKEIDINEFAKVYFDTFKKQGLNAPITRDKLYSIDPVIAKNTGRHILGAYDGDELTAAVYIIEDKHELRYLMGGKNSMYSTSGAPSLLLDRSIKLAKTKEKKFNFEGSIKAEIIRFFRSFGGNLTPYYRIYNDNRTFKKFRRNIK